MFLCYLDESGTPQIPGNTSHYILAGLSISASQWKACDREIIQLKKKYQLQDSEIHTAWIWRPYLEQRRIPKFESLDYDTRRKEVLRYRHKHLLTIQKSNRKSCRQIKKNYRKSEPYIHLTHKQRKNLLIKFSEIISSWNFTRLFAECIDKIHFDHGKAGASVEEQAFEQVVSRVQTYLKITSAGDKMNMGMLIHDNNPNVQKKLTKLMMRFHEKGTLWTKVKNIIETPLFVDSQLTSMVQVADLCSFALRRYLENQETDLFNNIFRRADRKDGRVVGVRHFSENICRCKICQSCHP